jgi:hypothetical protein
MPKTERHCSVIELQRKKPDITSDKHGVPRFVALLFGFYRRCNNGNCRRAKKCVGRDASCFHAFWPDLPEICKNMFREQIKARAAGAKTAEEIEAIVFPKMMAQYTLEEICEAAAQVEKDGW